MCFVTFFGLLLVQLLESGQNAVRQERQGAASDTEIKVIREADKRLQRSEQFMYGY